MAAGRKGEGRVSRRNHPGLCGVVCLLLFGRVGIGDSVVVPIIIVFSLIADERVELFVLPFIDRYR